MKRSLKRLHIMMIILDKRKSCSLMMPLVHYNAFKINSEIIAGSNWIEWMKNYHTKIIYTSVFNVTRKAWIFAPNACTFTWFIALIVKKFMLLRFQWMIVVISILPLLMLGCWKERASRVFEFVFLVHRMPNLFRH